MAFKGHAQAGNFSSYALNLPITDEINEDLRIAGGKVRDIQLTAQRKQQQADQYISALNNKFKIEQQNRDTNSQFMLDNYKAVYEGEQREFKGRMAELQREMAQPKEKSELQKALPAIIALAKVGMGAYAAHHQGQVEEAGAFMSGLDDKFKGSGASIYDVGSTAEKFNEYLGKGLSEAKALEGAMDAHPNMWNSGVDVNPDMLNNFTKNLGVSQASFDQAAAAHIQRQAGAIVQAEAVNPQSNLSALLDARSGNGYPSDTSDLRTYVNNSVFSAAGGGDLDLGKQRVDTLIKRSTGAADDIVKWKDKAYSSLNENLVKNTTRANKENLDKEVGIHLSHTLNNKGVDAFVADSMRVNQAYLQVENGQYTSQAQRLEAQQMLINHAIEVNPTPGQYNAIRDAYYKDFHAPSSQSPSGPARKAWDEGYQKIVDGVVSNQRTAQNMYEVQAFQVQEKVRTMEAEQVPAYIDGLKRSGAFQNLPAETQKWLEGRRSGTLPSLDKGEAGVGAIAKIPNYKGEATRAINERILALHDDKQNQNIDQGALELTQSSVLLQASEEYDTLVANYPKADKAQLMSKAMKIAAEKVLPDKNSLSGAGTALEPLRDNLSKREIEGVSISTTRRLTKEHLRDSLVVPDTKLKVMMQANPDLLNSTTKGIEAIINISRNPNGVLDENTVIASLDSAHAREIFKQEQNKNRFATYGDTLLRLAKAAGASTEALGIIKENSTTPQEAEWAYKQGINARHNETPTREGRYLTKHGVGGTMPSAFAANRNIVPVPGTSITMNKPSADVLNGVIALGDELGIDMRSSFTSGHRSIAKQQSLIDRWHAGDADIVHEPAKPGESTHHHGDTFDAGLTEKQKGVLREYERRNPGVRFIQDVPNDPVHYRIEGTPQPQQPEPIADAVEKVFRALGGKN